eukprot:673110-Prorocentrum_minimum.AAC.1
MPAASRRALAFRRVGFELSIQSSDEFLFRNVRFIGDRRAPAKRVLYVGPLLIHSRGTRFSRRAARAVGARKGAKGGARGAQALARKHEKEGRKAE